MSATELKAEFNAKVEAKFKELYTAAGKPSGPNDTLAAEYFTALDDLTKKHFPRDDHWPIRSPPILGGTRAHFSALDGGLIKIDIDMKLSIFERSQAFRVSDLASVNVIYGLAPSYEGKLEGTWDYEIFKFDGSFIRVSISDPKGSQKSIEILLSPSEGQLGIKPENVNLRNTQAVALRVMKAL
ncbi:hypothetical protein AX16_002464 [Volvariella volvacea WC 439]|nr:hypothetical protein AX16_002464 [Volvariella volvacea WC 439]